MRRRKHRKLKALNQKVIWRFCFFLSIVLNILTFLSGSASNQATSTSDNVASSSSISSNETSKGPTRSRPITAQRQHGEPAAAHHGPVKSTLTDSRSEAMSLTVKELVERTIKQETSMSNTKPEDPPKRINYLREKILQLCLPTTVKNYLLYNREI